MRFQIVDGNHDKLYHETNDFTEAEKSLHYLMVCMLSDTNMIITVVTKPRGEDIEVKAIRDEPN